MVLDAIINPQTPMAFLPADLAFQVTIASYILVGSSGVMIWDILNNLTGDYKLLTKHRVGLPTLAYFISRCVNIRLETEIILDTNPAPTVLDHKSACLSSFLAAAITWDCARFEKIICAMYPIAIPATSLLFFFRVKAVFDRNQLVVAFFGFMWLAVLAGCLTVTQGVTGVNIGPTKYCLNFDLKDYVSAAAIIPLVNDTLVFLAISWRLMTNTHVDYDIRSGVKTLMFGEYLPAFSKTLFQDGQAYYLTTVTTNLMTVIMLYIYTVPITYRTMFTVPNIALMNIMACRVFRNTKFGVFRETSISTSRMGSTNPADRSASVIPLSLRKNVHTPNRTDVDTIQFVHSGVEITKTIECEYDSSERSVNLREKGSNMV
ncbi:hypothetical protein CVT24_001036 [Panaeolus cyanescens]|uniref:G-protein coupled receptors family 1 profile domain-containing protein n=1 Tax=Panaeolus cyanescens TaxID=181874 RepID=A0A409VX43_9AGAR|nr:hypothetical protein CVT24_001036 [Panaeolus cyanescens]